MLKEDNKIEEQTEKQLALMIFDAGIHKKIIEGYGLKMPSEMFKKSIEELDWLKVDLGRLQRGLYQAIIKALKKIARSEIKLKNQKLKINKEGKNKHIKYDFVYKYVSREKALRKMLKEKEKALRKQIEKDIKEK